MNLLKILFYILVIGLLSINIYSQEPAIVDTKIVDPNCEYSIYPNWDQYLNKNAGSFTIQITTEGSNCFWDVTDNATWVTVSPYHGMGNATITVEYGANNTTSERTATIDIEGDKLYLIQDPGDPPPPECPPYEPAKSIIITNPIDDDDCRIYDGVIQARDNVKLTYRFSYSAETDAPLTIKANPDIICDIDYRNEINPASREINTSLEVGSIPGSYNVTPTGALTYAIPIDIPAGTAGIQPNLSLVYNSQMGSGIMGIGWNLAGLSQITRTPQNLYVDGNIDGVDLQRNDRFALDGNRLILVSGGYGYANSEYVTEMESFSKITANLTTSNGPTWFKVETKDGKTLEYGNTDDSKAKVTGKSTVLTWKLNKIEDKNGNYMLFKYKNLNGENVIDKIEYTANDAQGLSTYNSIEFFYEEKDDQNSFYIGDGEINQTLLLYAIRAYSKDNLLREFNFKYKNEKYSFLTEISKSGLNGNSKLNSTFFNWTDAGTENFTPPGAEPWIGWFGEYNSAGSWSVDQHPRYLADVNGDGRDDIIGFADAGVKVTKSTGSGFSNIEPWHDSYGADDSWSYKMHPREIADVNGDGLADVVAFADNGVHVSFSNGYNHFVEYNTNPVLNAFGYGSEAGSWSYKTEEGNLRHPRFLADINGDGRSDIIGFAKYGVYVSKSTGYDFETEYKVLDEFGNNYWNPDRYLRTVGDVNGDGMADIVGFAEDGVHVCFSNGQTFTPYETTPHLDKFGRGSAAGSWGLKPHPRFLVDVNGDKKADIVGFSQHGVDVALSTGTGFTEPEEWIADFGSQDWNPEMHPRFMADVNGDGRADIIACGSHGTYVSLSTGESFEPKTMWVQAYGEANDAGSWSMDLHLRMVADVDGDGKTDFVGFASNGVYVSESNSVAIQKLENVSNGLNNNVSFNYKPLTESYNFYTKLLTSVYPLVDIQVPLYVVSSVVQPDGKGNTTTTEFKYKGARVHKQGKGFLGFYQMTASNDILGQKTITTYDLDPTYYIIDKQTQEVKTLSDQLISRNITDFSFRTNTINPKSVFSYPTKIRSYDNLTKFTVTKDFLTYDDYGNILTLKETYGSDAVVNITNSYTDEGSWCDWRLSSSTVDRKYGSETSDIKTSNFEYDVKGNLLTSSANDITVTYDVYDLFGNVKHTITSAPNTEDREVSYTYDPTGRFIETTTNVLDQTSTFSYNSLGQLVSETGIDGLPTSYTYDDWDNAETITYPNGKKSTYSSDWLTSGIGFYTLDKTDGAPDVKTYFDRYGRKEKIETVGFAGTMYSEIIYNEKGQVEKTISPYYDADGYDASHETIFGYDPYGRTISIENNGLTKTTSYSNNIVTETFPSGKTKVTTLDATGKAEKITNNGIDILYNYFSNGQVKNVTAPGSSVSMTYDDYGFRETLNDPDAGQHNFTYNAYGQLESKSSQIGSYGASYDVAGRVTTETGHGNISYTYILTGNGINQIDKINDDQGEFMDMDYDQYGRITEMTERIGDLSMSVDYTYDDYGRTTAINYPGGFGIKYVYDDESGTLEEIYTNDDQLIWKLNEVNSQNQVTKYSYGNGLETVISYDADNFIQNISTGSVQNITYSFDKTNNRFNYRTGLMTDIREDFTYDNLNQLETITSTTKPELNLSVVYKTSVPGQIDSKSDIGTYQYTEERNAGPHAISGLTNVNSTYNPVDQDITYTTFGKVSQIMQGNYRIEFTYGPDQQRKTMEVYLSDVLQRKVYYFGNYERHVEGSNVTELYYIYSANGLTAIHKKLNGADGDMYYVHNDHLGSIHVITNELQQVQARYYYNAWGVKRNLDEAVGNIFQATNNLSWLHRGYTGHEHITEIGMINMNGRVYDPDLGMFISCDPYIQAPDNPLNFNRYAYVYNNPLVYTDPDGEWINILIGGIVGGITNLVANWDNIENVWDGCVYFNVGGLAGATAGAVGGEVGCLLSEASSIVSGIASGAAAGAVGGFINGTGNSWEYGADFDEGLLYGAESAGIGLASGAVGGAAGSAVGGYGFFAGTLSGMAGGASGGFVGGAISAWSNGENFGDGLVFGINTAWKGALIGGAAGGVSRGYDSYKKDLSFWTGADRQSVVLTINSDGTGYVTPEGRYIAGSDMDRARYRTYFKNNRNVTIVEGPNGSTVTVKLPRNVNGLELPIGGTGGMDNFQQSRRSFSFTTLNLPDYLIINAYRYQSNTSSFSLRNLIHY